MARARSRLRVCDCSITTTGSRLRHVILHYSYNTFAIFEQLKYRFWRKKTRDIQTCRLDKYSTLLWNPIPVQYMTLFWHKGSYIPFNYDDLWSNVYFITIYVDQQNETSDIRRRYLVNERYFKHVQTVWNSVIFRNFKCDFVRAMNSICECLVVRTYYSSADLSIYSWPLTKYIQATNNIAFSYSSESQ